MYLSEAAALSGRRNNFNFVRLIAALSVLISHSFALSTGDEANEPLARFLGINLGSLAVVVFFITSGFLVGGSLLLRGEPGRFLVARIMRIYPALIVVIVLTSLLVGPIVSTLPLHRYFASSATYQYLVSNITAVFNIEMNLPEVFSSNPFRGTVNGALWTLRYELWMYGLLLVAWLVTAAHGFNRAFAALIFCFIAVGTARYWRHPELVPSAFSVPGKLGWLTPMFFLGVAIYLLRNWIRLHWSGVVLVGISLVASALIGPVFFKAVYPLCLAYLVMFVVYALPVIEWTQHRDYSYGLYIYAFLVQQLLAWFIPGVSPVAMSALAVPLALICAVASWHLVEKPSLNRVDQIASRLRHMRSHYLRGRAAPMR